MKLGISEILERADKLPVAEKKDFIIKNDSYVLRSVFWLAYSEPKVEWRLTKKKYEYKPSSFIDMEGMLINKFKFVKRYFLKESETDHSEEVVEKLWIEFLENLDPKDAVLMEALRNHTLPYKSLTKVYITKTFPELFGEEDASV